jgi:micrococcal nuclease
MRRRRFGTVWLCFTSVLLLLFPSFATAHRSGCHRWHSCPSDTGSYVCGDLGYCSQCPDNEYCEGGRPRTPLQVPSPLVPQPQPSPPTDQAPSTPDTAPAKTITAQVTRVIDGDTIEVRLDGRVEKVRYIGVNTPETRHPTKGKEPGGEEAKALNRKLVAGKTVRLELDVQQRDRYGGLLAYVYVDRMMVNAELVRQGYAQVMTIPPNVKYQDLFLKLQRQARERGKGLWGQ